MLADVDVDVDSCRWLLIPANCQFLSILVNSCQFLSMSIVNSCRCQLSILVDVDACQRYSAAVCQRRTTPTRRRGTPGGVHVLSNVGVDQQFAVHAHRAPSRHPRTLYEMALFPPRPPLPPQPAR
jgi:hypothetical protein